MSEPFLGQISMFGFNFAPRSWAKCDGQILPINQNQSLYSLLGTTYGGDGRTSFALPDLRGRVPIHFDATHRQGQAAGTETVSLSSAQMPAHTHAFNAVDATATGDLGSGNVLAQPGTDLYRSPLSSPVAMGADSIATTGAGQGHENMQPYLTLNFCICVQGLFPSRN